MNEFNNPLLAIVLLSAVLCMRADGSSLADLEIHGFATQGVVHTSANNFFGESRNGSPDYTELGVNATLHASGDLRLAAQLLSRRAGKLSDGHVEVDYAVADFTLSNSPLAGANLLMGRLKNPLGLYNETRDVAFTRPGISLPQTVYFEKVRDLLLSADGLGIRAEGFFSEANASAYLAFGQPRVDENAEYAFLGAGFEGDFESAGLSFIANLSLESPSSFWKTSISLSHVSLDFEPDSADLFPAGEVDLWYGIASLQLSGENWTLSTEYMVEPIEWNGFSGTLFDRLDAVANGYYAQLSFKVTSQVELMARYGEIYADRGDRSGKAFSSRSSGLLPAHTRYSKVLTLGARWDATDNLVFRAEYQKHNGTFVLSSRENPDPSDLEPDWDLFAIEASYRF